MTYEELFDNPVWIYIPEFDHGEFLPIYFTLEGSSEKTIARLRGPMKLPRPIGEQGIKYNIETDTFYWADIHPVEPPEQTSE
jgi:hypothetical protein